MKGGETEAAMWAETKRKTPARPKPELRWMALPSDAG